MLGVLCGFERAFRMGWGMHRRRYLCFLHACLFERPLTTGDGILGLVMVLSDASSLMAGEIRFLATCYSYLLW